MSEDEPTPEEIAQDEAAAAFAAAMPPPGPFFAARVGDPHICPMIDGVKPHVGGPILPPGCPTVLIGNMPAARIGDMATCASAPDVIIKGEPTVHIGGSPAARFMDSTAHGGMIVMGFPTVIIGSASGGSTSGAAAGPPGFDPFAPDVLRDEIGNSVSGEGSSELQKAMNTLYENRDNPDSPEVAQALDVVAKERGVPRDQIEADWNKFQQLLADQRRIGAENGHAPVDGLSPRNAGFMGSRSQLRSGAKTGQVLGVDPVFGALLNPTGGMVGAGNNAIDLNDSGTGYHGATHDAAGYAYNYHNSGPGYDYLGTDNRDTADPFSGQRNGIGFYRENVPDRTIGQRATDATLHGAAKVGVPVYDTGASAVEAVGNAYDAATDAASDLWDSL